MIQATHFICFLASLTLNFSWKKSKGRSRIMFLVFSNMESTVSGNDEHWSSDKPGADNLCALQKLGEILDCNKMQIAALEFQSCSSRQKPFKLLKSPESISKHKAGDGLRFLGGIGKGFRGIDAMKEQKREMHRLMNGKNLLPESRASSSNELVEISPTKSSGAEDCSDSSEAKQVKQVSEAGKIRKLSERLKILEEETEPLKQEILQHMEERKKVVAEIYQQFQTIHHRLQFENQVREEGSPHDGSSTGKFLKKAGSGMAGQKSYTDSQVYALFEEGMGRLSWLQEAAGAESECIA